MTLELFVHPSNGSFFIVLFPHRILIAYHKFLVIKQRFSKAKILMAHLQYINICMQQLIIGRNSNFIQNILRSSQLSRILLVSKWCCFSQQGLVSPLPPSKFLSSLKIFKKFSWQVCNLVWNLPFASSIRKVFKGPDGNCLQKQFFIL